MSAYPEKIEVVGRSRVVIDWDDGHHTELEAGRLRAACPCAGCREAPGRRAAAAVLDGEPPVEILDARLVGNYAITFTFGPDGHATGIYPFSTLRSLDVEPG